MIQLEPLRIEVVRDESGEERIVATDARDLLDSGNEALAKGAFEEALRVYDQLLTDFSESRLAVPALFNAGLALEGLSDFDGAIARYLSIVERGARGRDAIDAHIRAGAVQAELERWSDARKTFGEVLARDDLNATDRLEAMTRRGYAVLESGDLVAAEKELQAAVEYYEKVKGEGNEHLETDYFIAMAHHYLAEVPRRQFDAHPIRLPDDRMAADVEAKANFVILASERYNASIAVGNIYWATASGFKLAAMQQTFWKQLVGAPIPPQLGKDAAKIYIEEVHKQAMNLLEKALSIHQRNVELAEVYKTATQWSDASSREATELVALIAREKAGDLATAEDVAAQAPAGPTDPATYVPGRISL